MNQDQIGNSSSIRVEIRPSSKVSSQEIRSQDFHGTDWFLIRQYVKLESEKRGHPQNPVWVEKVIETPNLLYHWIANDVAYAKCIDVVFCIQVPDST